MQKGEWLDIFNMMRLQIIALSQNDKHTEMTTVNGTKSFESESNQSKFRLFIPCQIQLDRQMVVWSSLWNLIRI